MHAKGYDKKGYIGVTLTLHTSQIQLKVKICSQAE